MSTVQFFALLFCAFCLAALLLGLVRPTWVLPLRRATRWQVLLLYSAACLLVLLIAGELPYRSAHAQIADPLPEPLAAGLSGAERLAAYRDAIAAVGTSLGVQRAVLLGHSMGGAVALLSALLQHQRVRSTSIWPRLPGLLLTSLPMPALRWLPLSHAWASQISPRIFCPLFAW